MDASAVSDTTDGSVKRFTRVLNEPGGNSLVALTLEDGEVSSIYDIVRLLRANHNNLLKLDVTFGDYLNAHQDIYEEDSLALLLPIVIKETRLRSFEARDATGASIEFIATPEFQIIQILLSIRYLPRLSARGNLVCLVPWDCFLPSQIASIMGWKYRELY